MQRIFSTLFSVSIIFPTTHTFLSDCNARVRIYSAAKSSTDPVVLMGTIDIRQGITSIKMNGSISRLTPGLHGFHIHENGDTGVGCLGAGPHYNPFGLDHGGPGKSYPTNRHVGDLGNINASQSGVATINGRYVGVWLCGPFSILGRSVVVHEKEDDLGRGTAPSSKTTGNSGARLGCGVIGIV